MRFPPAFIEELKHRLAVSEVVGRRVALRRAGREYQALCPFHNEKTPSFTVNDEKGFYHCFGCGAHGDVLTFVMEQDGLSYPEAVERLAGDAGMALPVMDIATEQKYQKLASLYEVMEWAATWFQKQLYTVAGRGARDTIQRRGIHDAMVAGFRLGFAPDQRRALSAYLTGKGATMSQLREAGLVTSPEQGEPYDRFRGRLIFPIMDRRGRVIAFGGRALSADQQPKYLNSPETPLFHKGRELYAHHLAGKARAQDNHTPVIVAEGYTDVIALTQAGFPASVAPLGTAITAEHLQLLWKLSPEPVLCLDGDAAGQRAMQRAARLALPLLAPERTLRCMVLPAGEDPDSLVQSQGANAIHALLKAADSLVDITWHLAEPPAPGSTPESIAGFERRLTGLCERIQDGTIRKYYREHLMRRLWETYRRNPAHRRFTATEGAHQVPRSRLGQALARAAPTRECLLLAAVTAHPALLELGECEDAFGQAPLTHPGLMRLRDAILAALPALPELTPETLREAVSAQDFSHEFALLRDHLPEPCPPEEAHAAWSRALRALEKHALKTHEDNTLKNGDNAVDETAWEAFLDRHKRRLEEEV